MSEYSKTVESRSLIGYHGVTPPRFDSGLSGVIFLTKSTMVQLFARISTSAARPRGNTRRVFLLRVLHAAITGDNIREGQHPTLVRKEHHGAFFKDLFTRNTTDGIDGDDFSWYHTITSPRSGRKTQRGVLIEAVI